MQVKYSGKNLPAMQCRAGQITGFLSLPAACFCPAGQAMPLCFTEMFTEMLNVTIALGNTVRIFLFRALRLQKNQSVSTFLINVNGFTVCQSCCKIKAKMKS